MCDLSYIASILCANVNFTHVKITRQWKSTLSLICTILYRAFHKHANSKVQKPHSQLGFSLPSIIITITSNEPWNRETHKTDRNPPIRNHNPWPFEPVKVKFCFLRGPLRWLTAAKNAIVRWLLNFRIRMFVKIAVNIVAVNCKLSDLSECQVHFSNSFFVDHLRSKFLIFNRMIMPLHFLPSPSLIVDVCNCLIFNNV